MHDICEASPSAVNVRRMLIVGRRNKVSLYLRAFLMGVNFNLIGIEHNNIIMPSGRYVLMG